MKKTLKSMALGIATACLLVTSAQAAVLSATGDNVHVNAGGGFQAAGGVMNVAPGTIVSVGSGGSAVIQYATGCSHSIKPGQVFTVPSRAPSCLGSKSQERDDGFVPILIGVGAVGGAVALISSRGGSKRPASP